MTAVGVVHTGFTVKDLDRSVRWYTEMLGMVEVKRQHSDTAYTRRLVGMDDAVLEIAFLALQEAAGAGRPILELIQYTAPAGAEVDLSTNNVGNGHLALAVEDLEAVHRELADSGVTFRNPPVEIDAGANRGSWACYLEDPDGITIELFQPGPLTMVAR